MVYDQPYATYFVNHTLHVIYILSHVNAKNSTAVYSAILSNPAKSGLAQKNKLGKENFLSSYIYSIYHAKLLAQK